jgi:hypothetical protein
MKPVENTKPALTIRQAHPGHRRDRVCGWPARSPALVCGFPCQGLCTPGPKRLENRPWSKHANVEIVGMDALDPASVKRAVNGCMAVIFYLIHSMIAGKGRILPMPTAQRPETWPTAQPLPVCSG